MKVVVRYAMQKVAMTPRSSRLLQRMLKKDPVVAAEWARLKEMDWPDKAHGLGHFHRVANNALHILEEAGTTSADANQRTVLAALLHDAVTVPKDSPLRSRASAMSAEKAREWLTGKVSPAALDEIAHAVEAHSFSRGLAPQGIVAQAVQDADRIEALGKIGVKRWQDTSQQLGRPFFHPTDPWAQARVPNDLEWGADHWQLKLGRLAQTMQTAPGRRMAERETEVMRDFLRREGRRIGVPFPEG
jgi:uncharacterized protein